MYAQENANARPAVISVNTPGFQFLAPAVVEKLCAEAFPQLVPKVSINRAKQTGRQRAARA